LRFAPVIGSLEILNPLVSFLDPEAQDSERLDDDQFGILWAMISCIVDFSMAPMNTIIQFFNTAMNM
jgi:hypothetical protein